MKSGILTAIAAASLTGAAAFAFTDVEEYGCVAMSADRQGAAAMPGYSVLERSRAEGRMTVSISADFAIAGIMCRRNTIIPAEQDFEVPLAGLPLYISTDGADGSRIVVLTIEDDQFVVRIMEGELTASEREQVASRIETYYAALEDES
ncbi:hypothetical protein [Hyphobacterium indicum]|uniref:hypothetical protein n=1 Tax=Hyphobacterium indicum TaxID=2162714 RepID=UPI000D6473BF|nr:hypothetical protein [Hyphobacterium indicum]